MRRLVLALALVVFARPLLAQDLSCNGSGGAGDLQIRSLSFSGNDHFSDSQLSNAIVTTPSSWWRRVLHIPIGAEHCVDTLEVARDALRLRLLYRQHGYYHTQAAPAVSPNGKGGVGVLFHIAEGPPVLIDSLAVSGLDSVPDQLRTRLMRPLDHLRGGIYDRDSLRAVIDTTVTRLLNNGYAHASDPLRDIEVDEAANRAKVRLTFLPGKLAHIGRIDIVADANKPGEKPAIDTETVHDLLSINTGDLYRQRDLLRSQRDLYALETYNHVDVELLPDSLQPNDTSLTVRVFVAEGLMKSMRVGVGWASLDCARTQGRLTDRNFFGGAQWLELNARLSHIALCPGSVRQDTAFSNLVNYYAGATLRLPSLFGPKNIPSITVFSERTSEFRTYVRSTPIGVLAQVTRDLQPRDLRAGLPLTIGYQLEYGRTKADPAVFCQIFNRCSLTDIDRLQQNSSLQVISATLARDRTNNVLDPSRGSLLQLVLRSGTTSLDTAGATRFTRAEGDASFYRSLGGKTVLAARLELAGVFSGFSTNPATDFVPPEERLYAGGPNSVRGYSQNLLGPLVYIVDSTSVRDSVVGGRHVYQAGDSARILQFSPTGGNTMLVGNLELRTPSPFLRDLVQLAGFVDAGLVWNRPTDRVTWSDVRLTPGVGVRVNSFVGPFRVDVAYNPYPSSVGSVYFVDQSSDALRCVSPNNPFDRGVVVPGVDCPSTFRPVNTGSFFSRLTFNFSIGQAF
ncbi:MAG TPA: BamA/TamA family outer membrane protein [Gemmatimonadaceae bacterium]|jgi:outer membrane protein insertion porin family/translocation and assembly module TamA